MSAKNRLEAEKMCIRDRYKDYTAHVLISSDNALNFILKAPAVCAKYLLLFMRCVQR